MTLMIIIIWVVTIMAISIAGLVGIWLAKHITTFIRHEIKELKEMKRGA